MNLAELTSKELLGLHARLGKEFRKRRITRSANNPTGDLAESLFCIAFGWQPEANSRAGFDAIDKKGKHYQIKGCTVQNKSRQLSAIRNLDGKDFDVLAGVIFSEDYGVLRAALIPHSVIKRFAKQQTHTNSHRFFLRENVWDETEVQDVTEELSKVAEALLLTSNDFPDIHTR
jgi:hypothetical protein